MASVVDTAVQSVLSKKKEWTELPYTKKLEYLLNLQQRVEQVVVEWPELCSKIRKVDGLAHLEHAGGAMGVTGFGALLVPVIETYTHLVNSNQPTPPISVRKYQDQNIVLVYPYTTFQKMVSYGVQGEIWLSPGASVEQKLPKEPALCAILGPGNTEAPVDCLSKLFLENKVVVYKPNPVNEAAIIPIFEKIWGEMIADGYIQIVVGGAEVGSQLVNHPLIDEVLMTGGCATYDRIVWGNTKEEQEKNKAAGKKLMSKPFDAELGAASPWIIVPGEWTQAEIEHHAELLVACKLANSSAVCASPQVLLVDKEWPQRSQFLDAVRKKFESSLPVPAYYPGSLDRCQYFKSSFPQATQFPKTGPTDVLSPVLIPDVATSAKVVHEEAFAPVLAEVPLDTGNDPAKFLKEVVNYCNETVFGSLSCSMMIHPSTEAKYKQEMEEAVAKLEWGSIAINDWAAMVVFYALPWGAFPKHNPNDIQSGMGKLSNVGMYQNIQKTVIRAPFMSPSHAKLPSAKDGKMFNRMMYFSIRPSWWRLLSVISAATIGI